MLNIQDSKVLIQIGTNDGNDEFLELVKKHKPSKVILVEPVTMFTELIQRNYKGIENVFIESVAITDVEKGEVTLVIPKERKGIWHTGNYTLLPMNDWGDDFEEWKAPSMTFNQLCEKHGITDIHFLMIDTEGYDYEIIKSIDFSKVNIDKIRYEKFGFPTEVYSRHGEKANQYGIAGIRDVANLLMLQGYTLYEGQEDIIAVKH